MHSSFTWTTRLLHDNSCVISHAPIFSLSPLSFLDFTVLRIMSTNEEKDMVCEIVNRWVLFYFKINYQIEKGCYVLQEHYNPF